MNPAAQPSAKDGVRGDEPALPWRDISELEPSDDPHWFLRKDGRDWVVDGPRATQNHSEDQEDGWQWFCKCESPPISATTAAGLVDDVMAERFLNEFEGVPNHPRSLSKLQRTKTALEAAIGREVP